ncbi:MucBP domain-containing protein [Listeria immobilis]|uniref:MucBP domain-containing protein n=1 Tax=Listeria immobilis TaxID=2713502 RepID=UPI0016274B7D|nr:MucBP domain-containing protein [Listeria immobilis]MBC1516519.1 leucine-rich repeat protein [Listeria immobilis]
MIKKIVWASFSLALVLFLFPVISSAATSGDFEYTANGNEATITDYTGTATDVTIPATVGDNNEYAVTTIGNSAFKSKGLTSVTIPDSVTTIVDGAFTINSLQQLVLPNSVQTIGINSFSVNDLEQITLSTSLTNIPRFAFLSNKLKSVEIPANVTNIEASAFENNYITDITIQNPNIQLAYQAFAAQTILSKLIVPSDKILPIENYIHFNDASSQLTMNNLTVTDLSDGVTYDPAKNALVFSAEPKESTFSLYTGTNRYDSYYDISEYGPSGKPIILFEYTQPVIVTYKDESGTELASSTRIDGTIGDAYTSTPKTIDGYTLKETTGNPTGQFTNTTQNISYIYEKDPIQNGTVTVKYQDESGNSLAQDTTLTGEIGSTYQTESKNITGYKLTKVDGSESGTFNADQTTVTYVYEKITSDENNSNGQGEATNNNGTNTEKPDSTSVTTQIKAGNSTLPKTSDTSDNFLFAVGGLLTALATGILFFKRN